MRLFASGLRKLARRLATYVTFGLLVGLLVLILVAVGATADQATGGGPGAAGRAALLTFPGAYQSVLSFIVGLGGLLAVVYGAAISGSEWTWGTLKNAIARGESRSRYVVLTFASVAVIVLVGLAVTFLIGIGAAVVGSNLAGISTAGLGDRATLQGLPERLARGGLAIVEEGALGFAVATLFRSQLAGIGAGIALYFGEQFARLFLPDIVKWLPFDAATAVLGSNAGVRVGNGAIELAALEPNVALVVAVAWLIGAVAVSALVTERADIGG